MDSLYHGSMEFSIEALANPRDRDLRREGIIIAEGKFLTERYLASGWPVGIVVCAPHLEREVRNMISSYAQSSGSECPVQVLEKKEMEALCGFSFHRGVLAAGPRPDPQSLPGFLVSRSDARRIVVCPELTDGENLGSVIRSAAAFGFDGVLVGSRCTDPLSRRVLKVSMGGVFTLPIIGCGDEHRAATEAENCGALLKTTGFTIVGATAPAPSCVSGTPGPSVQGTHASLPVPLQDFVPPEKTALVLGSEGYGIPFQWEQVCDSFVTIPMTGAGDNAAGISAGTVDSLNVGVAAGIIMWRLQKP